MKPETTTLGPCFICHP